MPAAAQLQLLLLLLLLLHCALRLRAAASKGQAVGSPAEPAHGAAAAEEGSNCRPSVACLSVLLVLVLAPLVLIAAGLWLTIDTAGEWLAAWVVMQGVEGGGWLRLWTEGGGAEGGCVVWGGRRVHEMRSGMRVRGAWGVRMRVC